VADGKSRLSGVLSAAQRQTLNRWLVEHTLKVASEFLGGAQHCLLISPCPETLGIARAHGAQSVHDEGVELNRALAQGMATAQAHGAQHALIVSCDLPLLNIEALTELARLAAPQTTVIAPDACGRGTNALLAAVHVREFAFGDESFVHHGAQAVARGDSVRVCRRHELAFDVDTADDYNGWRGFMERTGTVIPGL
jgi:2-phospho-L-lactate guanylyltransferase